MNKVQVPSAFVKICEVCGQGGCCLLLFVNCLLLIACCLLPSTYSLLHITYYLKFITDSRYIKTHRLQKFPRFLKEFFFFLFMKSLFQLLIADGMSGALYKDTRAKKKGYRIVIFFPG